MTVAMRRKTSGAADGLHEVRRVVSIVPNWNRRELALDALRSLAALDVPAGYAHRLMLVDNGSDDGSVEAVRQALPDVSILALPENVGFARGANAGILSAVELGARWTMLVNNDTLAQPGMLTRLLTAAESRPDVGIVVPTVVYHDRPDVVWPSAGMRRPWTLAAVDTTAHPPTTSPYEVEWAVGCCMLVRRELWEAIGLFDTRFRVYYEDHDLCLRARAEGWRILHVPEARIRHRVAASTGPGSPEQAYLLARSSIPYFWTHSRGAQRVFIVFYRALSLFRRLLEAALGGRPAFGRAHLAGIRDGLRDLRAGADVPSIPVVVVGSPAEGGARSTS